MKVYARQVQPEQGRLFNKTINVWGNTTYKANTSPLFERVSDALINGELAEAIDIIESGKDFYDGVYKNVTEVINDMLPPENKKYSTNDIHELKELVSEFSQCSSLKKRNILCKVLSIVTGYEWGHRQINGNNQSRWNYVFYPVKDWTKEKLDNFEALYFNQGSDWMVHNWLNVPQFPEDVDGATIHCNSYDNEGIKKEIADYTGAIPEDVILFA